MSAGKSSTEQKGRGIVAALAGKERDEKGRIPQIWTIEKALNESNKYKNRTEFRRLSDGAYQYLARKKALHMLTIPYGRKRHRVDFFEVFCAIKSCKTKSEMQKRFSAEYHSTRKHPELRAVFESHFGRGKTNRYWNHERAIKEARKFKTRSGFAKQSSGAYGYVMSNNLDEVAFSHMDTIQSCFDVLYIWASRKGDCYIVKVGVTSLRLGLERIRFVAKKSNITPDIVWRSFTERALRLEAIMKKIGKPAGLTGFNGSSEFFIMDESQFNRCKRLMKWINKGQNRGLKNEKEDLLRLM